jgi:RNA polymerase sigma-54 factor
MSNTILQMTTVELAQRIEQELQENPALEVSEEEVCPLCQTVMMGETCPNCGESANQRISESANQDTADSWIRGFEDVDEDPLMNLATPLTLRDHVRWQARLELSGDEFEIACYLIDCLNDDGYLEGDLADIATQLGCEAWEVERVLKVLQTFEPVGVGARDLQETLLIQLDDLREPGACCDLAERIVRFHLKDLAHRRTQRIAQALSVSWKDVTEAATFITKNLTPYPGRQFRPAWRARAAEENLVARPDVFITRQNNRYEVEVAATKDARLRVNSFYREFYAKMQRHKVHYTETERQHVAQCVLRAELFVEMLTRRRETLSLITTALIERQREFFDHDGDHARLKPLTKTHVAQCVGRDVSTVSRATRNKFAQIPPCGAVVSFDVFFQAAPDAKNYLRQLIAQEDAQQPLSDQEMARRLRKAGYGVARRTVAKYRGMLKIPSTLSRRAAPPLAV